MYIHSLSGESSWTYELSIIEGMAGGTVSDWCSYLLQRENSDNHVSRYENLSQETYLLRGVTESVLFTHATRLFILANTQSSHLSVCLSVTHEVERVSNENWNKK